MRLLDTIFVFSRLLVSYNYDYFFFLLDILKLRCIRYFLVVSRINFVRYVLSDFEFKKIKFVSTYSIYGAI